MKGHLVGALVTHSALKDTDMNTDIAQYSIECHAPGSGRLRENYVSPATIQVRT